MNIPIYTIQDSKNDRLLDAHNRVVEYILTDVTGVRYKIASSELKRAIRENKLIVDNLTLTSDDRLILKRNGPNRATKGKHKALSASDYTVYLDNSLLFKIIKEISNFADEINMLNYKDVDYHRHMFGKEHTEVDGDYNKYIEQIERFKQRGYFSIDYYSNKLELPMGYSLTFQVYSTKELAEQKIRARLAETTTYEDRLINLSNHMIMTMNRHGMVYVISDVNIKFKDGTSLCPMGYLDILDLSDVDFSECTDLSYAFANIHANNMYLPYEADAFKNCKNTYKMFYKTIIYELMGFENKTWDSVETAKSMFSLSHLDNFDFTNFNMVNLKDADEMFMNASTEQGMIKLNSFNPKKLVSMNQMFRGIEKVQLEGSESEVKLKNKNDTAIRSTIYLKSTNKTQNINSAIDKLELNAFEGKEVTSAQAAFHSIVAKEVNIPNFTGEKIKQASTMFGNAVVQKLSMPNLTFSNMVYANQIFECARFGIMQVKDLKFKNVYNISNGFYKFFLVQANDLIIDIGNKDSKEIIADKLFMLAKVGKLNSFKIRIQGKSNLISAFSSFSINELENSIDIVVTNEANLIDALSAISFKKKKIRLHIIKNGNSNDKLSLIRVAHNCCLGHLEVITYETRLGIVSSAFTDSNIRVLDLYDSNLQEVEFKNALQDSTVKAISINFSTLSKDKVKEIYNTLGKDRLNFIKPI